MICLANVDTAFGGITVLKNRQTGAVLYSQGGCYQSKADRRGISLVSYIHAIFAMVRQARARKVLMIGCGGGTLATMLHFAGVEVTVIDVNAQAFEIARRYFHLPADIRCVVSDGLPFLTDHLDPYDAIVLDAYDVDRIPDHFCRREFFRLAKRRLGGRNACFIANVHVADDFDPTADQFADEIRRVWRDVRILDEAGAVNRNALVLAGRVRGLQAPVLLMPPDDVQAEIVDDLSRLVFRPLKSAASRSFHLFSLADKPQMRGGA